MSDLDTSDISSLAFMPFPKIPRLNRTVIVTEKIDGTNACIAITHQGEIRAASRTRWISPESDNFGFAKWVAEHREELLKLGPGRHFGEWWGCGIQRGYGLSEKRFSLFNVGRWGEKETPPACCSVVPLLGVGAQGDVLDKALEELRRHGSRAAPGFMRPEGVVVFHTASHTLHKVTLDNDASPKGVAA
jgi:hypothetical protein